MERDTQLTLEQEVELLSWIEKTRMTLREYAEHLRRFGKIGLAAGAEIMLDSLEEIWPEQKT